MSFIVDNLDTGLIIFFLGVIVVTTERMRREICLLKKVAWANHPDDMK